MRAEQIKGGDRLYYDPALNAKHPRGSRGGGVPFVVAADPDYRKVGYSGSPTVVGIVERRDGERPQVRVPPRDLHGPYEETNERIGKLRTAAEEQQRKREQLERQRRTEVDECVRRLSLLGVPAQVRLLRWGAGEDGPEFSIEIGRSGATRLAECLKAYEGWPS